MIFATTAILSHWVRPLWQVAWTGTAVAAAVVIAVLVVLVVRGRKQ